MNQAFAINKTLYYVLPTKKQYNKYMRLFLTVLVCIGPARNTNIVCYKL